MAKNTKVVKTPDSEEKENEVMEMIEKSKGNGRTDGDWIDMTEKEVAAYQAAGRLVGYDPATKQGLLNEE